MDKWRDFYVQRMGTDGEGLEYPVCESVAAWGIFCKSIPFKVFEEVKEPAKRSYFDEHGDDEYIPSTGLFLEAYTIKVKLGCKLLAGKDQTKFNKSVSDVRQSVGDFLAYLRSSGMIKLYSTYTRIGRQNVRLESVSDNATWQSDDQGEFLIFEVTFKVNDPVTDVVLP